MKWQLLMVCWMVLHCAADVLHAEVTVFVLAGQSNMSGRGKTVALSEAASRIPQNVTVINRETELTSFRDTKHFGPEVGFAHELAKAFPKQRFLLIKYAVEGTSSLAWHPNWTKTLAALAHEDHKGSLYTTLMGHIRNATRWMDIRFGGFLWMQGERDAKLNLHAALYRANLHYLIDRIRTDTRARNLPFLIGRISPPSNSPFGEKVREAQVACAKSKPCTALVMTDDLSKFGDDLHFDTTGQIKLGQRFFRAYEELSRQSACTR